MSRAVHGSLRRTAMVIGMLFNAGAVGAVSAAPVERFACTFSDGQVRVLAHDLAPLFGERTAVCRRLNVEPAAPQAIPLPPMPQQEAVPAVRLRSAMGATTPAGKARRAMSMPAAPAYYAELIREASHRQQLDPEVVTALIYVESAFRPRARSPKGALGLMQVMPATAARYGVVTEQRLLEPAINIEIGTRYLRDLSDLFDGRLDLVLAAYNAGEGAVTRWGNTIPPFPETQAYVKKINGLLKPSRNARRP